MSKVGKSAIKGAKQALKKIKTKATPKVKVDAADLFYEELTKIPIVVAEMRSTGVVRMYPVKWIREHHGIPGRKFRFDFADEYNKVAVEIQGGVFQYGGHSTGMGITRDCEKLALSNINGWTVFLFTSGQVRSKEAINWLREYYKTQV